CLPRNHPAQALGSQGPLLPRPDPGRAGQIRRGPEDAAPGPRVWDEAARLVPPLGRVGSRGRAAGRLRGQAACFPEGRVPARGHGGAPGADRCLPSKETLCRRGASVRRRLRRRPQAAGAPDPPAASRYIAACSGALAATGQGKDAARLDDKEGTRLRKQALDWLKADLALYTKRLESGSRIGRRVVTQQMENWQKDADLAG